MLLKDKWLSQYFDQGAYIYKPPFNEGTLPRGFISAKVPVADTCTLGTLYAQGFDLIETLMHFRQIDQCDLRAASCINVRSSVPDDRNAVVEIARDAFVTSRFYQDRHIPYDTACMVKASWVDNFYNGKRGDRMIVAEEYGKVIGFVLMIGTVVDLIAVAKDACRKGAASQMLGFANGEAGLLTAGTQIMNTKSIAFYQKNNFVFDNAVYVLHRHG
jgi:GNAT superfamily N-acetyltransferase